MQRRVPPSRFAHRIGREPGPATVAANTGGHVADCRLRRQSERRQHGKIENGKAYGDDEQPCIDLPEEAIEPLDPKSRRTMRHHESRVIRMMQILL